MPRSFFITLVGDIMMLRYFFVTVSDYVPNCDVVFESCTVNCGGPLGGREWGRRI